MGDLLGDERADRREPYDRLGLPEQMPFILDDDGSYDLRLNQFRRA